MLYGHTQAHCRVEQASGNLIKTLTFTLDVLMVCRHFYFQYIHHSCAFFPVISREFSKVC